MEVLIEGDCKLLLYRRIAYRSIGDDPDTEQTEKYFIGTTIDNFIFFFS
ncbi:MAG: hypothetical protein H8D45_20485 [Bacteroidetes bacterium]|nr:hypothetical protein [Bacteroidota bacterium]MBL7104757.1 hypothetical protein [Bacteroidales bacterium]